MPLLSWYARRKKCAWFFQYIPKGAVILEVGCASGWLKAYAAPRGYEQYQGLDLVAPADIVGDIRDWKSLGLKAGAYDVILAFEVVEHVDCFEAIYDLLREGGLCMLTSPVPERDWIMQCLERLGLNQRRSSPHDHLIDFRRIPFLEPVELRCVAGLSQWGVFRKPASVDG